VRVIVTRPMEQAEPLAQRLRARGHTVEICPLVRIEPLGDDAIDVTGYDWVVVTSPNGAAELTRRARELAEHPRVAAIGPGTAAALRARSVQPALVASVSTQEGLLAELPQPAGRVLVAAAEGARRVLADSLTADFLPLYRTVPLRPERFPDGDLVVLASASAACSFAALGVDLPAVTIGPLTSAAARERGIRVVGEATTHDLDGLVAAVQRAGAG
jgi:uroporphyrinogen III methyltransferase/synthase